MVYQEYERYKKKYYESQKHYEKMLNLKEHKVLKGINIFDNEQLDIAKTIMYDRKELLELKEKELRASPEMFDKVYVYRFLNKLKIYQIAMKTGYSERQICRYIKEMHKKIDELDILA